MKTKVTIMISSFILFAVIANAQGGFQHRTVEESANSRTKNLIALLSWINQSLPM